MAPSPSPRNTATAQGTPIRTPSSRSRLNFPSRPSISPSPNNTNVVSTEHPVEVVGRIRDYPDRKEKQTAIQVLPNGTALRVKTELGYRDFSLDGISLAENDDLDAFYKKFVESRIDGVKTGGKCTIMMYGPTGSGKSHTMFGCGKEPGIVYRALHNILGDSSEESREDGGLGQRVKVKVTVVEIYNEEIYDLLASNASSGVNIGWSKNTACRVRLEVMGKKVKNAMFISGSEAGKIAKEVAKVEKRRVVKNTLCNERSSRSHCLITLDVPAVGGRLMLVDMAGSENIDQAGLVGFEAKLQTAKINQGNIALKRVVEAIANGDSHVPFRDSKLTMLLQDSFEDDGAKILMVLCASPDPRDIHKTIGTLEYGAKAKCIVRFPNSPSKEKPSSQNIDSMVLGARIMAMDEYILKLQMDNKLKEKEKEAAHRELIRKEEEVAELRAKLEKMQEKQSETNEEIESKVEEKARLLKQELERKFEECQKSANTFVEVGKRKMEEKILQQQEEVEMLRQRLEEIESELEHMKSNPSSKSLQETDEIMEIERTSEIGETGELVASSARVLEGMQACVQQMKDKFMSPQDEVQKLPDCTGSEGGSHLSGFLKVTPGGEKTLCSFGLAKNNSDGDNPEDSRPSYKPISEHSSLANSLAPSSDDVMSLFYPVDKDERVLMHQQFPFLKSNTTENHGSGLYDDGDEEEDAESTRFLRKGWLPTVYEEEEEDMKDNDDREYSTDKGITSSDRNVVTSGSLESRVANGCRADEKTFESHFEKLHKLQGESCLQYCSRTTMDELATKGESGTRADRLAKPGTDDVQNLLDGNVGTSLLGSSENEKDQSVSRRSRIENIFLLCGNHRELQARNTPVDKRYEVDGVRSDPLATVHDITPKEDGMGSPKTLRRSSSWNNTVFHEKTASSLSPEFAGCVTSNLKNISPRESKVSSLSSSPDIFTIKEDSRSPRRLMFGDVVGGGTTKVPTLECLNLDSPTLALTKVKPILPSGVNSGAPYRDGQIESPTENFNLDSPILALTEVKPTLPSYYGVNSGAPRRDSQTEPPTESTEDQIQEEQDGKCDVYVKWETSKEASGKLIKILKMPKSANLMDLRRMIELHLGDKKQDFTFLMLGDPTGNPVSREKEASVQVTSLPDCQNQRGSRLACLRLPSKRPAHSSPNHPELPFNSLENKIPLVSVPSTGRHFQASNRGQGLPAAFRHLSKAVNQTADSSGKTGQKVGSAVQVKGLRL